MCAGGKCIEKVKTQVSFLMFTLPEQLMTQRSECAEIVQECSLWEAKKRCKTEASLGSCLALSCIFLLQWKSPIIRFTFRSGYSPVSCASLKAIPAILNQGHGVCQKAQIYKTGLASNPHKYHEQKSDACHQILSVRENKLFQYQEPWKRKGEKKVFEQKADKSSFDAVPADTLGKMFLV